jgi:hypothetical protein
VNVVQIALGDEHASTSLDGYTRRPADYEDRLRSALDDDEVDDDATGGPDDDGPDDAGPAPVLTKR